MDVCTSVEGQPIAIRPMEQDQLTRQIERCRRLAGMMVDDEARHALEALAEEYEAKLRRNAPFMLRPSAGE